MSFSAAASFGGRRGRRRRLLLSTRGLADVTRLLSFSSSVEDKSTMNNHHGQQQQQQVQNGRKKRLDDFSRFIINNKNNRSSSFFVATRRTKTTTTVDTRETKKFEQDAELWWRERDGPFGPLHSMNPVRCSFIKDECAEHFMKTRRRTATTVVDNRPLSGLRILDVGCGGGLLSESLSRLGADVVGLDAGKANVEAAKRRQKESQLDDDGNDDNSGGNNGKVKYICDTAEDLGEKEPNSFDVVCALEVIEHVTDPRVFANALRKLVKDDGLVFVSTISKSMRGVLGAIVFAERVAKMVPAGTHDANKFLHPSELAIVLERAGLRTNTMAGMEYNLMTKQWKLTGDLGINYIASATVGTFDEKLPLAQEDVHDKRYQ